ncbi:hypothetical protein [Hymenobacter guriensis]|uniref:Uncharacterized protein n=1 Tax=Hymenobacter guriensis TaxID=2793065 RepID=A0ABS0L4G6_9BACT|nr:hypothetical protein [Hymenobacter guriensis]MBG8555003.1 hypothetical protein [Hymenobacter guriensis]
MSENTIPPLELMHPQQRAWLQALYTRYQHQAVSPTSASSSSLEKALEHFNALWQSLACAPVWLNSTESAQRRSERTAQRKQKLTERMQQLRQTRSARIRQRIESKQRALLTHLNRSKADLTESKQRFEESSKTLAQLQGEHADLLQQQQGSFQQAVEQQVLKLGAELTQLADSLRMLWEKNENEAACLAEDEQSWTNDENGFIASEQLTTDWQTRSSLLEQKKKYLHSWKSSLQQKKSSLHNRKLRASCSKPSKPSTFSNWTPASNEQRAYWLRKSKPLRELLRNYVQLSVRCQNLKAELFSGGFLSEDPVPDLPARWVDAPAGW